MRILSTVAGLSSGKDPWRPDSALAAAMASLRAKKTEAARRSGGSPTACGQYNYYVIAIEKNNSS